MSSDISGNPRKMVVCLALCLWFAAAVAQEANPGRSAGADAPPPLREVTIAGPQAQQTAPVTGIQPEVSRHAQQMPRFPGGEESLGAYLKQNLHYPEQARERGVQGVVIVEFEVDTDGTLEDIRLVRDIGSGCGEEAIRLVRSMPPWQPGMRQGKAVKASYRLKLGFVLD